MERRSVETVVNALNRANVRYLVVGGLAVVAHGLVRFTADVDLVLDPEPPALRRAVEALSELGYRPRAPVDIFEFADGQKRARWRDEKGMMVFSLFSPTHGATEIDLFVDTPFDFERVYGRAQKFEVGTGVEGTFIGLADLIEMKRRAGRPQDIQDVEGLQSLGKPGNG